MKSNYDYSRYERIGMPEAILCESKNYKALKLLLQGINDSARHPVLLTRLTEKRWLKLNKDIGLSGDFDAISRTAFLNGTFSRKDGSVSIVSAGTSDLNVALEASRTLNFLGYTPKLYNDVGVAGLHRILDNIDSISMSDVVVVVAGMDAALASVVTGLIRKPVIGVPTSVGYGVCQEGISALNAMLASCAQGLMVMNIDNGFGAASAAARILGGR